MAITKLDARQSVLRTAMSMIGSAANDRLDTVFPKIDAELAKLFEDRNLLLVSEGDISFPAGGTSVTFASNLRLHVNSQVIGGSPTLIDLGATTRTLSANGRMLYAVINRSAGTAVVTSDATTLPAQTSANQEVVLLAKRVDSTDGTKRVYFRNGFAISEGQTSRFGVGGITYNTSTVDSTTFSANATIQPFSTGIVKLTNATLSSVSGIPAGSTGQVLILQNQMGGSITINNDEATASAPNRIYTGTGANVAMANNATFTFIYDTLAAHWMLTSGSGTGGSAGTLTPVGTIVPFHLFGQAMPQGNAALDLIASGWYLCDGSVIIDQRSSFANPTRNPDGSPAGGFNASLDNFAPDLNGPYASYDTLASYMVGDKIIYQGADYAAVASNGPVTPPLFANLIGVGTSLSLAVRGSDGSAWAWGQGTSGQLGDNTILSKSSPVSVVGNISYNAIIGGDTHVLGRRGSDGSLWAWGSDNFGQLGDNQTAANRSSPISVLGNISFARIAAGTNFSAGIDGSTGFVWTWGLGTSGQLGNNAILNNSSPVAVTQPNSFSQVSAGTNLSLAIRDSDGSAWSWGQGTVGQLGNNTILSISHPVSVVGNHSFTAIRGGDFHVIAISGDGSAWTWGLGTSGQLGNDTITDKSSPISVLGANSYIKIAAGTGSTGAIRGSDGSAWVWGLGTSGELGNNTILSKSSPISVLGANSYIQISGGSQVFAAIRGSDGSAWAWGSDVTGKLGHNTVASQSSPVSVVGANSYVRISCGASNTAAIRGSDGSAWAWGLGTSGQLGNNTITSKSSPVSVLGNNSFSRISVGADFTAAIRGSDGSAWAWGDNTSGNLGDGTLTNRSSPVSVLGGHSFINIIAYNNHTIAVKADGSVWVWGDSSLGQLGNNQITTDASSPISVVQPTSYTEISASGGTIAALRGNDGSAWTWGLGTSGQLGNNTLISVSSPVSVAGNISWAKVSVGNAHMVGIRGSDRSAWAWGNGANGVLGRANSITNFSSPVSVVGSTSYATVSAGFNHSAGLDITDGSAWCWGLGTSGQLGNNTITSKSSPVSVVGNHSFIDILADANHTVAVKADGSVWAWGLASTGQLGNNQTAVNASSPVLVAPATFMISPLPINPNFWMSDFTSTTSIYRRLTSNQQSYPAWSSVTAYVVGSKVSITNPSGTYNYTASVASTNVAPPGNGTSSSTWSQDFISNNGRDHTFIKGSTTSPSDASGYHDSNTHQLTVAELAVHNHTYNPVLNGSNNVQPTSFGFGVTHGQVDDTNQWSNFVSTIATSSTGGNVPHVVRPRNFDAVYIIKIF